LLLSYFAQQQVAELMDDCYHCGAEIKDSTKALCVMGIGASPPRLRRTEPIPLSPYDPLGEHNQQPAEDQTTAQTPRGG
jgi:hypothetical protein